MVLCRDHRGASGLSISNSDSDVIFLASISSMYSSKFSGSKAAEFCGNLTDSFCVCMNGGDIEKKYGMVEQCLVHALQQPHCSLMFIIDTRSCDELFGTERKNDVQLLLENMSHEIGKCFDKVTYLCCCLNRFFLNQ